jgi:hypothetical protein
MNFYILFTVYLTTLSVAQTIKGRVIGLAMKLPRLIKMLF